MLAVRSTGSGVEATHVELSGPDDWPVVHVAAAGICGSDLHLVASGPSATTLGHEFAGWLEDGTSVAVLPVFGCGHCLACIEGHVQRCATSAANLLGVTLDGGMAEQVRVHPDCVRALPDGLTPDDACLAEPLAVALHGIHRFGVRAGDRALVLGAGTIGLCAVAAAVSVGATVDASDPRDARSAQAAALGAGTDVTGDYDVVIDAAGTQASMDAALQLLRPGGTIGLLACHWSPVSIGLDLQVREASLVTAYLYGDHDGTPEFDSALELLATSALPDVAITHRLPIAQAHEAFELAGHDPTAGKVVLTPGNLR